MTIRWKALSYQKEKVHQHKVLDEAGGILNDLLHAETNHHTYLDPCTPNIDHCLSVLNPLLTEFIALATCIVRERYHPSLATEEEMTSCHVKKVSQYLSYVCFFTVPTPNTSCQHKTYLLM